MESGDVTVNGRPAKASTTLRQGDVVDVIVPAPAPTEIQPEPIELDVLFEDEHLIVLNKQADIIVHPARSHNSGTMLNALAWRFAHESGGELSPVGRDLARPGVVHRLDRDTTGCIVFAKTEEAHWKLAVQFERREVDKRYLAVTHGLVEPDGQVIDLPLGPHPSKEKGYRERRVVRHDELGKPSVTICRVRERYPGGTFQADGGAERASSGGRTAGAPAVGSESRPTHSLVELELRTGRTHQIRVHLSHLGWPIVADDMYGGRPMEIEGEVMSRQALHAALLAFGHPITGEDLSFVAPLAPDMRGLIEGLRAGGAEPVRIEQTVPLHRLGL